MMNVGLSTATRWYAAFALVLATVTSAPAHATDARDDVDAAAGSAVSTVPLQGDLPFRDLFDRWKAADRPPRSEASVPSQRPLDNFRYTSPFGMRSDPFGHGTAMHAGVDLAASTGTPVHATADGIVSRAERARGYGNLVQLDHGARIQTRYGHLSRILVTAGQRVHRGDVIALVGSTGRSTGSHLHYEVRVADRAIDPLAFMASGDERLALQETVGPAEASPVAVGGPKHGED